MQHEGQLKLSTGLAYVDVEPYPRMKLMKLYYIALQENEKLPDKYGYKLISRELTRFRMKVVDENMSIKAIEDKIAMGMIEQLIIKAHEEVQLLKIMNEWQPWDHLSTPEEDEEFLRQATAHRQDNPFSEYREDYTQERHDKPERNKKQDHA